MLEYNLLAGFAMLYNSSILCKYSIRPCIPGTCDTFELDIRDVIGPGRVKLTLIGPDRWQNGKEVGFHLNTYKVVGFVPTGFLAGTDESIVFDVTALSSVFLGFD